jgi:hypothetical protein
MRKKHDSDSYISEIECPKRTEKSCIALKSCASVANNNIEHIVICPLHATSMPINQDHNKDGYPGTQKEGHEQVCFWRSKWGIPGSFSQISLDRMIPYKI